MLDHHKNIIIEVLSEEVRERRKVCKILDDEIKRKNEEIRRLAVQRDRYKNIALEYGYKDE